MRKAKRLDSAQLSYQRAKSAFDQMFKGKLVDGSATSDLEKQIDNLAEIIKESVASISVQRIKYKPQRKAIGQAEKQKVDKKKSLLALKEERERLKAKKDKERQRIEFERLQEKKIPTRVIDESNLIPLRLDAKTVVYIKPGADPEAVKRRFIERNGNRGLI